MSIKKFNRKGFTLIELLAVIVILAILVAVAVPAVTRYLNQARRGTFATDASSMIEAVRNDYISGGQTLTNNTATVNKDTINKLLEKKLGNSPYGGTYNGYVKITRTPATTTAPESVTYHVCLTDGSQGISQDEASVNKDNVLTTVTTCTTE